MVHLLLFGRVEVINDFQRVELIFDLIEFTEFLQGELQIAVRNEIELLI